MHNTFWNLVVSCICSGLRIVTSPVGLFQNIVKSDIIVCNTTLCWLSCVDWMYHSQTLLLVNNKALCFWDWMLQLLRYFHPFHVNTTTWIYWKCSSMIVEMKAWFNLPTFLWSPLSYLHPSTAMSWCDLSCQVYQQPIDVPLWIMYDQDGE